MPQLTIKRPKDWTNSVCDYAIIINGKKVGTIWKGKTKTVELKPGVYQVMAKVDWCSSQSITVDLVNNQEQIIEMSGYKFSNYLFPVIGLTVIGFRLLDFWLADFTIYMFLFIILIFGYMTYYLTIGRKHYLRIRYM